MAKDARGSETCFEMERARLGFYNLSKRSNFNLLDVSSKADAAKKGADAAERARVKAEEERATINADDQVRLQRPAQQQQKRQMRPGVQKQQQQLHREQLGVKSIQGAKMKVQEFVEDTIRMRSELSGLETDLRCAQQMEASTKFRAESIRSEIEGEKKRYEDSKTAQLAKMEAVNPGAYCSQ